MQQLLDYLRVCACVRVSVRMCKLDCQRDYPSSVSFTKGHMFLHEASSAAKQRRQAAHTLAGRWDHTLWGGSHMNQALLYVCACLVSSHAHTCTHTAAPGICASQILVYAKIPALYSMSANQWPILDMAWITHTLRPHTPRRIHM